MSVVRRINPVSIFLLLVVVAGGYLAWKIVPIYYQATKVDNILSGYKQDASELNPDGVDQREDRILDRVRDDLLELGIDDPVVSFGAGYSSLDVSYSVEVHFVFGKSHTFHFDRTMDVPQDKR